MATKKTGKGVFAPRYYEAFCCLADKCRHSCCVAWEICIDKATFAKYKKMKDIIPTVLDGEDGPCFALREDGRCPHLTDEGLCRIILEHGEGDLSQICRNHPRFFNRISAQRVEAGIGIACEQACRLVLTCEEPYVLTKVEALGREFGRIGCKYDPLTQRDRLFDLIKQSDGLDEAMDILAQEGKIAFSFAQDEWYERFLSLEILAQDWEQDLQAKRQSFLAEGKLGGRVYDGYYKRLLTYFVYRHVSAATNYVNLQARLAFCLLSIKVIRSLFEADLPTVTADGEALDLLADWARRYSAEIEYCDDNVDELIFAFESKCLR